VSYRVSSPLAFQIKEDLVKAYDKKKDKTLYQETWSVPKEIIIAFQRRKER